MTQTPRTIRRVTTANPANVDALLTSAIEGLIPDALALNCGIRVTRMGAGEYTVETATDVLCGYTVYEHG